MRTIKQTTLLLSSLLLTVASLASGTRGGGESVRAEDGKLYLRDLVDPSVCEYKSGIDLRQENPEIDIALNKIAKLDWYFATGLRFEINHLQFCFTKDLIPIGTWDWDSAIVYEPQPKYQTAIRLLGQNDVYINKDLFNEMGNQQNAFLVIHEAMHAFIPLGAARRNESLRAVVKTLERVIKGEIASSKAMHKAMDRYNVIYPWTAGELSKQRKAIEFALSSSEDQKAKILGSKDLNALFDLTPSDLVYSDHMGELSRSQADRVGNLLEESGTDLRILDSILNLPTMITAFDALMVAFSTSQANDNEEYQNHILNSVAMQRGPAIFNKMKIKDLEVKSFRIVGTEGFYLLGITEDKTTPVPALAVRPFSVQEWNKMPTEIQGLMQLITMHVKRGEFGWNVIRKLVTQNENFYAAFSVQNLQIKLKGMQSPVKREKAALAEALPELSKELRKVLFYEIETNVSVDAAQQMDNEINWSRLVLPQN